MLPVHAYKAVCTLEEVENMVGLGVDKFAGGLVGGRIYLRVKHTAEPFLDGMALLHN